MTYMPADDERGGGIQVIARASSILNALGETPGGMSLGQIAKAVDLPRSTVQRIVNALAHADLVRADRPNGVMLGPTLLRLVAKVHTDVVAMVDSHLAELTKHLNETVALARGSGRELAMVHVLVAERDLRVVPRVGTTVPLHSTAGGKALLALESDRHVTELMGRTFERLTLRTVHSRSALLRELGSIRSAGVAYDEDETEVGIASVAMAVDTILGKYAVSVVLPTARLPAQRERIVASLQRCKDAMNSEIGKL
ncbi:MULTISPECIES: IclR family transcriptional regulator [Burkholderiaceae]|uniref:Transcriptional regulator n=1 Tax=Paraburkholderia aromaticivorans TaxID=2026199 RepID=A0A248VZB8_9BURK|nr:IclR family transcriptional regulator [Paraburkholderia aromaticivorans]ASW04344.1 transcriptional regulator [Paraburkholderia aromaticivorans]